MSTFIARRNFQLVSFLFLLFISCFSTAIATPVDEDNNGVIKGKVVTSDGKPAAEVAVILQGTSYATETDGTGAFTFRNIPAGSYQVVVSQPGYSNISKDVTVEAGKTATLSFQLDISRKELGEIVVTGSQNKLVKRSSQYVSKVSLSNLENPQVYTTISKDLLAQQLIFSVDDAMRNAPGITRIWEATGRSGDGGSYYNSRGFMVQSQLRNGIAGNVTSKIDASNIESIEVIKGPSATLFGSTLTSYGGLINRVMKKPYDHFGGEVSYAGGSYSYNRLSADINTPLDSAKNVLFRLNTAYTSEDSWQDNGYNKSFAFAPSISYKVTDRLSFLLDAEFFSGSGTGNQMMFFPYNGNGPLTSQRADELKIDYKRAFFSNDLTSVSRNANFFATMNYQISSKWTSQTVASITNSFSNGSAPYLQLQALDSAIRSDQSTNNSKVGIVELQQNFIGDFKIGNMRSRFVGGLDFFYMNENENFTNIEYDVIPTYGEILNYGSFNRAAIDARLQAGAGNNPYLVIFKSYTYSAYASEVLNITDKLAVQAALRIDHFDRKGNFDKTTGTASGGYNQTVLSPKFGIVYEILKDRFSVFGNYQNGFKNLNGQDYKRRAFKPQQANQIEGGVKMDLFEGKLTSTLSYYNILVKDITRAYTGTEQTDVPNPQIQDGTQRSKGFEAQVIANPIHGLSIVAGYAYNDSKYEKADATVDGLRPGTASSPTSANLWINYRLPVGTANGLNIGFGGNYASDNKVINSTTAVYILPAYTVLNASVSYDTKKFRIGVKSDNLTNKHYWIGYGSMNPQKLRSVVASLAFKF